VLLLGSGGGTDAWAALRTGAREVTVVEPDRLVIDALRTDLRSWAGLDDDPRAQLIHEPIRAFAQRDTSAYDVVELTLTEGYRPVSSGVISLGEDYRMTTEAFSAYLARTKPDGLLVVTRWSQTQPTESLRTLALIVEALERRGVADAREHVLGFRSFQTVTFLASPEPLRPTDTDAFFDAITDLRYDLVVAPRIRTELLDRWARVPALDEHERSMELLAAADRGAYVGTYPFDVSPPTDDRPFFHHFFRLEQTPALLAEMGRRWQPFGGGGYFILVALLGFAVLAAVAAIVLPLALARRGRDAVVDRHHRASRGRTLGYVVAIGLAFLFVEVTFVQRSILVLGDPTHAFAAVVGTLLVASGVGSILSPRIPWRPAVLALAVLLAGHAVLSGLIGPSLLALPDPLPAAIVLGLVAPVGFLMGVPFARAMHALAGSPSSVAWAWAANGSASVVSGILATMVSLAFGFGAVLGAAAVLYLVAALLAPLRPAGERA
jgi:hypothetical protein